MEHQLQNARNSSERLEDAAIFLGKAGPIHGVTVVKHRQNEALHQQKANSLWEVLPQRIQSLEFKKTCATQVIDVLVESEMFIKPQSQVSGVLNHIKRLSSNGNCNWTCSQILSP